jgi:hypothetical protein
MPQKSPGSLRSSRNRALEIGTQPGGFSGARLVVDGAGMPKGAKGSQPYKEQAPAVGGKPSPSTAPFTAGSKG